MSHALFLSLAMAAAVSTGSAGPNENRTVLSEAFGNSRKVETKPTLQAALFRSKLMDQIREQEYATAKAGQPMLCVLPAIQPLSNYSKLMEQKRSEMLLTAEWRNHKALEKWGPLPSGMHSKLSEQKRPEVKGEEMMLAALCNPWI